MNYLTIKITCGALATFGLYSVLYRETKFYRFFEHIFLGLAAGWALVAFWTETLRSLWWDKMMGTAAEGAEPATPGYWLYVFLPIIGLMAYFVFNKKHNWLARIPIGIIIGLWSGQQIQIWFNRYGPQINAAMKPLIPTTFSPLTVPVPGPAATPEARAEIAQNIYLSQALTNLVFVVTLVSVLSYFLYSIDLKGKALGKFPIMGRWLMMVGFGAIFGSTVMTRFTLLIDRMYFLWIEWINALIQRSA